MKQLRYRLLIMLAALMLLPTGVGAAERPEDTGCLYPLR